MIFYAYYTAYRMFFQQRHMRNIRYRVIPQYIDSILPFDVDIYVIWILRRFPTSHCGIFHLLSFLPRVVFAFSHG